MHTPNLIYLHEIVSAKKNGKKKKAVSGCDVHEVLVFS